MTNMSRYISGNLVGVSLTNVAPASGHVAAEARKRVLSASG